jgi:hypothetical protein
VAPDLVADEWIGLTTSTGNNLWKLVLRTDRTGILTEVYTITTNEATLYFEISKWVTAPAVVTCVFRPLDVHDPLKMAWPSKMTCIVEGDRLKATLQNSDGGWKENILFWRANTLNGKLKMLEK